MIVNDPDGREIPRVTWSITPAGWVVAAVITSFLWALIGGAIYLLFIK